MTDRRDRDVAADSFGDVGAEKEARAKGILAALPPARDPVSLVDDVVPLGIDADSTVLDIGAGKGIWSRRLIDRYGCTCVAIDVARMRLRAARQDGIPSLIADVDTLPFADDSIDAIWCRDMLEMLADPNPPLREFFRVLRPGGGVALYTPWATELFASRERTAFVQGRTPDDPWFLAGRQPVDDAVRAALFEVVQFEPKAPLYSEYLLEHDPATVVEQLLLHSQLRRARAEIEAAIGADWCAEMLVWTAWQAYLLLGKFESGLWLLRKPA